MRTALKIAAGVLGGGAAPWTPASISGLVFDMNPNTLAGADGDAVASVPSGAVTFTAETTARPTLKTGANGINGKNALLFDGVANALTSSAAIDLSGTNAITAFIVGDNFVASGTKNQTIIEHGVVTNAGTFAIYLQLTTGRIRHMGHGDVGYSSFLNDLAYLDMKVVHSFVFDMSKASAEMTGYANAVSDGAMVAGQDANNTGNFISANIVIGGKTNVFISGLIGRVILYNRALSAGELTLLNEYLASEYGIPGAYHGEGVFYENSSPAEVIGLDAYPYIRTSNGARLVYETEAESVTVTTYNDIYPFYPTITEIGVQVDGADNQIISPPSGGQHVTSIALPAGAKTVEFINGPQSAAGGAFPVVGTFVRSLVWGAAATPGTPTVTPKILVYGDSIAVGQAAEHAVTQGWVQLVRNAYVGAVQNESFGVRSLYMDCDTEAKRTAFATLFAAQSPTIVWMAVGTNDYGLKKWSSGDFGAAYGDFLDKLHAAAPAAAIYAQTPLLRSAEGVLQVGYGALSDYRAAIATAISTREWATLVDGTGETFPQLADLDDGVHPTTAGHAIYAAAVKTVLSIV